MNALLRTIVQLLTFRSGGEHMPYAPRLLVVLIAAMVAIDIVLASVLEGSDNSPLWILVRMLLGVGLLSLLMQALQKSERFVQTAIALALVGLVFTLISAPILLLIWPLPQDPKLLNGLQASLMLPLMAVMFWFMCLRAWVLRGALDLHFLAAFMLSITLLLAETLVTVSLMKMFQ